MALDPVDLANDLKNDATIMADVPAVAVAKLETFFDRIAIHITNQIKRGVIDDVTVDTGTGAQSNTSNVK